MIELPEALNLAEQLQSAVAGKKVLRVNPPTKKHKFCWWNGDPAEYEQRLAGRTLDGACGFGIFVEMMFSGGVRLNVNDGVNIRLVNADSYPRDYQLLIIFDDGTALAFTVAMYGGICLHCGEYDNAYYIKSRDAVSPFSPEFADCFRATLDESSQKLSLKAFLATEQRFPGIGNGVLQDILLDAGLQPRCRLSELSGGERGALMDSVISVLREMTERGGRDTEKNIFGEQGGYRTKMSKNTYPFGCPVCGGPVKKEAYLGGSVYYCAACQKPPENRR